MIDIPEDVLKRTVFYREFKDLNDCITTIKALEKATQLDDVVSIKRGEWVKADSQQYFRKHYPCFTCSECGYRKDGQKKWNYCPNCGARMDKE